MRTITIPKDVPWTDEFTGEPVDATGNPCKPDKQHTIRFGDVFLKAFLGDQKWGANFEALMVRIDIAGHYQKAAADKAESFALTDSEWTKLSEVVKNPSHPYPMQWAARVPEFFKAILDAKPDEGAK